MILRHDDPIIWRCFMWWGVASALASGCFLLGVTIYIAEESWKKLVKTLQKRGK